MTDFPTQPDLDDELLSAYLDGELSPEEQARVDARLAADPAALQVLDQLRAASQAMKDLPAEKVGHDLRESILRRAEQAMLTSAGDASTAHRDRTASGATSNLPDSLPQFTIGRTTRGWVWAALAIAAGLMMMFLQPGAEQIGDLPQVASKKDDEVDKVAATDNAGRMEFRSLNAPASPSVPPSDSARELSDMAESPPASASAATSAPATVSLDAAQTAAPSTQPDYDRFSMADGAAAGAPALNSRSEIESMRSGDGRDELSEALAAVPQRGQLGDEAKEMSGDSLALSAAGQPSGRAELFTRSPDQTPRGAMTDGQAIPAAASPDAGPSEALATTVAPAASDFVVVRVVVNRDALQNKSFDRLLAKNGIHVETTPTNGESAAATGKMLQDETLTETYKDDRSWDRRANEPRDSDLVLVEATPDAIESCLADLHRDEANYLGVSVDDVSTIEATVDAKDAAATDKLEKKLTTDFGTRFNRGKVPAPQDVNLNLKDRWYYAQTDEAGATDQTFGFRGGGGGFGGAIKQEQEAAGESSLGLETAKESGRGRARRLLSWQLKEPQDEQAAGRPLSAESAADDQSSTTRSLRFGGVRREITPPAQPVSGKLQVLFILSPNDTPPSSPPADNRAE